MIKLIEGIDKLISEGLLKKNVQIRIGDILNLVSNISGQATSDSVRGIGQ